MCLLLLLRVFLEEPEFDDELECEKPPPPLELVEFRRGIEVVTCFLAVIDFHEISRKENCREEEEEVDSEICFTSGGGGGLGGAVSVISTECACPKVVRLITFEVLISGRGREVLPPPPAPTRIGIRLGLVLKSAPFNVFDRLTLH